MQTVKFSNTESKESILKRMVEFICNKDVIISKNVVSKLFTESSMEYEGDGTYCIIQLTWYDEESEKKIKFHTYRDASYIVDWIYIDNEFKSCNAMFGITDGRIFFEID